MRISSSPQHPSTYPYLSQDYSKCSLHLQDCPPIFEVDVSLFLQLSVTALFVKTGAATAAAKALEETLKENLAATAAAAAVETLVDPNPSQLQQQKPIE